MNQSDVVDAVQQVIVGDPISRPLVVKWFRLAVLFFLSRYPSFDLSVEWNGTADGSDYIYCPDDFQWAFRVWTTLKDEPVSIISPTEFAELKARKYSSSKIFCTVMRTRGGRKKLVFIDDIGAGTRVDMWYYQTPTIISIDMIPDYYTDVIVAWIRKQAALRNKKSQEYIQARADLKEARGDLSAMSQANPAAEIITYLASEWRGR